MILSYIIYIGLLAFCWLFSYLANRYHQKKFVWLIILALTLIAGLRDYSVGIDTQSYVKKFGYIANGVFRYAYGLETSFKYICYAVLKFFPNATVLLTLFAFLTNWCIITRFWELRKISSFSCMVLCYYMSFYFMTMNVMRQFCAIGIVFYCTRYLSQKKVLRFILGVLIAMLFHQTAVIGFVLLAINCLRWKELPNREKVFYIFAVLMIPVAGYAAVRFITRYAKYFSSASLDIGAMILLKLLFLAATLVFVFAMHRKYSYFPNGQMLDSDDRFHILTACLCYFVSLLLASLGYIFPPVARISWYFYLYEGVYFGMLLKGKSPLNRVVFSYVIVFLLGYTFVYSMFNNSQGTMPYLPIWK